ncbi:MAG TPA: hypothetical protein PLT67_08025 [Kiritimatiellia bacterium]|nr:hypothetical protein [Kiritimatiellia bacterium]
MNTVFEELKYFLDEDFPKSCNCGESFYSMDDFIERTTEVLDTEMGICNTCGEGGIMVNMVRQCRCGARMMIDFCTRRDRTEKGTQRRLLFRDLMTFFTEAGMDPLKARNELIRVVHGQQSEEILKILRRAKVDKLDSLSLSIQLRMLKDFLRC